MSRSKRTAITAETAAPLPAPAIGYRLSATGYRLSAIGFRLSAIGFVRDLYTWGPIRVPRDSVYLLADTRDIIGWPDSRFLGPVAVSALEAEAGRIVWPAEARRLLKRLQP